MTKRSEKSLAYRIGSKINKAEAKSRSRIASPFHFDHRRGRVACALPEPAREVTDSDQRDLAAAQVKRDRKVAKAVHAS